MSKCYLAGRREIRGVKNGFKLHKSGEDESKKSGPRLSFLTVGQKSSLDRLAVATWKLGLCLESESTYSTLDTETAVRSIGKAREENQLQASVAANRVGVVSGGQTDKADYAANFGI